MRAELCLFRIAEGTRIIHARLEASLRFELAVVRRVLWVFHAEIVAFNL